MIVTEDMVNRFLTWDLPKDFSPDGGISFSKQVSTIEGERSREEMGAGWWPVGTNLLTAVQARAMLEHVLGGLPAPMTREFCAAFPGTAAGVINALARKIDGVSST